MITMGTEFQEGDIVTNGASNYVVFDAQLCGDYHIFCQLSDERQVSRGTDDWLKRFFNKVGHIDLDKRMLKIHVTGPILLSAKELFERVPELEQFYVQPGKALPQNLAALEKFLSRAKGEKEA